MGAIVVLSGPSGSGKSTLIGELLNEMGDVYFSISTTTRAIRSGETEGVNYFYISKEQFEREIEEGAFLEWANVHGNYYGTSLKPVRSALREGKIALFDIDVQGHEILRKIYKEAMVSIFITTPSLDVLRERLEKRGTDSKEVINKRVENALIEVERIGEYDYLIINDKLEAAYEKLYCIIKSVRQRIDPSGLEKFVANWKI